MTVCAEQKKERLTITVAEAAARIGIGRNQAYEAARRGEIPTIRIGKRFRVPIAALDRFLRGETGVLPQRTER